MRSVRCPVGAGCLALCLAIDLPGQDAAEVLPVPASHTGHITIEDPMQWLAALLGDPDFRQLCRGGGVGDLAKTLLEMRDPDPARGLASLQLVDYLIPQRMTLAFPPETTAIVAAMIDLGMLFSLQAATFRLDDEAASASARADLRPAFFRVADALADLRFSLRLQFRDAQGAEALFDAIYDVLEAGARQTPLLQLEHRGSGARVAIAPSNLFARHDLALLLDETVIITDPDDPAVDEYWRWFAAKSLACEFELEGSVVRFVVGRQSAEESEATIPQPPSQPASLTALSYAFDLRALREGIATTAATWAQWRDTVVGRRAWVDDLERVLASIDFYVETVGRLPAANAGVIGWSSEGLHWFDRSTAVRAPDLRGHPILGLMPPDPAAYYFDATGTPNETLLRVMTQVESRMDQQWLRSDDTDEAERIAMQITNYYEALGPLRDLLTDVAPRVWRAPMAIFATAGGDPSAGAPALPGLAVATGFSGQDGGLALARRLFATVAAEPGDVDHDLELGVPTVSLSARRAEPATLGSDFQPHAFEAGDHLVFSTSIALSQAILASATRTPNLQLGGAHPIVATAATTGRRAGVAIARLGGQVAAAVASGTRTEQKGRAATIIVAITNALAGAADLFGPCTSRTLAHGDHDDTEVHLAFGRAVAARDPAAVLAAAREAVGPWPDGVAALVATGSCNYMFQKGRFRFVVGSAGQYHNEIDTVAPEHNYDDGDTQWSITEGSLPHTTSAADLHRLRFMSSTIGGTWTAPRDGWTIELAADRLPQTSPQLLVRDHASGLACAITLDPATSLPSRVRFQGHQLAADSYELRLSDYRRVQGRMLPHRAESTMADGTFYAIDTWAAAPEFTAVPRPPQPRDTVFDGPAGVEVVMSERHGLLARVRGAAGDDSVWLTVDPGASLTMISPKAAATLGIEAEPAQWTRAPKLRIGPATLVNVPLFVAPANPPARGGDAPSSAGAIGWSLFRRCCVELDLAAPSLALYPLGHWRDQPAPFVAIETTSMVPCVPVQLDGDTCLPMAVLLRDPGIMELYNHWLLDNAALTDQPIELGDTRSATAGRWHTTWQDPRIGDARLGPTTCVLPHTRLPALEQGPFAGAIGRGLFAGRFVVLFDLTEDRIGLVPR